MFGLYYSALQVLGTAGKIILISCTPLLLPSEADVPRTQTKWNDATLETLQNGHQLYQKKCGGCHYLYRPDKFSEEKWKHDVPEMAAKTKISEAEKELILCYLLTMREVPPAKKK